MKKSIRTGFFALTFIVFSHLSFAQVISVSATLAGQTATITNGATYDATLGGFVTNLNSYLPGTLTISNTGSSALILTGPPYITASGTAPSDFTLTPQGTFNGTIAAGGSQVYNVTLSASATNGLNKILTLTINSNVPVYAGSIKYSFSGITTGIMTAQEIGVSLYPNPSTDGYFAIQGTITIQKIVVSNVNGVKEEFYTKEFTTNLKGLLMVQLYTDKGIVSDKILVQ